MNLVLCGFMGCGKSTCGRLLAQAAGLRFVDMDVYIEQAAGCTVREIFAREGEAGFRARERAACRALGAQDGAVIAAGGGALCDPENVQALRKTSRIVFLDAPLGLIRSRLRGDTTRPLLQTQDAGALYEARRPLYEAAADLTVDASGAPEKVAAHILEWARTQGLLKNA